MPCSRSISSRAPAFTQMPSAALSSVGMVSVAMVSPFDRRVMSTLMPRLPL